MDYIVHEQDRKTEEKRVWCCKPQENAIFVFPRYLGYGKCVRSHRIETHRALLRVPMWTLPEVYV